MDTTRFLNEGIQKPLNSIFKHHKDRKRLLLVKSRKGFPAEEFRLTLQKIQLEDCLILDGFSENPEAEEIFHALELIHNFSPNIVMAIGGGKIIDIAKVLRLLLHAPICTSFEDVFPKIIKGQTPLQTCEKLLHLPQVIHDGVKHLLDILLTINLD